MERYAWRARIKQGAKAEYVKRHDEIWPEMVELLKAAGIRNYTIFYSDHELFGYYECEHGAAYAQEVQGSSPIVDKWNEYMAAILIWADETEQPRMEEVFRLD